MDYQKILSDISAQIQSEPPDGEVASYIPQLASVDPGKFGIYLLATNGKNYSAGDSEEKFSIQSIAKVLLLTRAIKEIGRKIKERVGVEPSGDPFNSLIQLEYEEGIPRNPFINSGALVVCDILVSFLDNPKSDFLNFVREISDSDEIHYDDEVAESEKKLAYRNRAIINLMKGFGNIENDTETVLDFYFAACSLSMSAKEVANAFSLFANEGIPIGTSKKILTRRRVKRINAVMQTCGLYNEAGEFAFRVGLPGKSGVGGGIAAVHPGKYAVAVWSPRLNQKGNSSSGIAALELLTNATKSSIF